MTISLYDEARVCNCVHALKMACVGVAIGRRAAVSVSKEIAVRSPRRLPKLFRPEVCE